MSQTRDPELAAWESEDVRDHIRYAKEDAGEDAGAVNDGPVEFDYDVYFMYPHVERVTAFTVCEAIEKAIVQLSDGVAVHNPQVEGVRLIPIREGGEVRVGVVKDGAIIDSYVR